MIFIVLDNEYLALNDLVITINKVCPQVDVYRFVKAEDALIFTRTHQVDMAFLDVEFEQSLEVAKQLKGINQYMNILFCYRDSQHLVDNFSVYASGYLRKPISQQDIQDVLKHLGSSYQKAFQKIRVQTFGNFDIFVNGKPLYFPRSKSKEILAYLVHKKGSGCTLKELTAILYEDQEYTASIQKQMQTYISVLMKTLKNAGIENIINKNYNHFSIDVSKIDCDYYHFLEGDHLAIGQYTGDYMENYSWGEYIVGYLDHIALKG